MTKTTTPIFIVGTGRCGTRTLYKMLSGLDNIEIHHEYLCTHVQPLAAKYYMGILPPPELHQHLHQIYAAAVHYSPYETWMDSSNKCSWIIKPLLELFPHAKFIHLIRDGRKVTNSFFRKLQDEMYDDQSVQIMMNWLDNPSTYPQPPAEKRYWWNIPRKGQPFFEDFPNFDQFQRTCYHWTECNRIILDAMRHVPENQKIQIKLEDLTSNKLVLKKLLSFLNIPYDAHFFEFLQVPQGVIFPLDARLNAQQQQSFNRICGEMMQTFNYDESEEYEMDYGQKPL